MKRIVTIYEDPFTRLKPEGQAEVLRVHDSHPITEDGVALLEEYAEVRFLDDDFVTGRHIITPVSV